MHCNEFHKSSCNCNIKKNYTPWCENSRFKIQNLWLLPQKRVLVPKICFFVCVLEKVSSYTWWWWKKSPIEVSSLFSHLKMSKNLEESVKMPKKIWNLAKSEYYPPRHPGTYHCIIIIQVITRITNFPLLMPNASSSIVVNFISF